MNNNYLTHYLSNLVNQVQQEGFQPDPSIDPLYKERKQFEEKVKPVNNRNLLKQRCQQWSVPANHQTH